jgi:hypothetical protein
MEEASMNNEDYGLSLKIKEKFPIPFTSEQKSSYFTFTFSPPPDGDYRFKLYLYKEGNMSIGAELVNQPNDYNYFWSRLIEQYSKRSIDDMQFEVIEVLNKILKHETRIIQKRGLLFWHFSCQYHDGGQLKSVGGNSTLRFPNVKVPYPKLSEKIYRSKALL